MIELIWRLEHRPLDREDRVEPIFRAIARTPSFDPDDYDLNQKEQWRDFELERTVVDALTQRTQLVRIRGTASGTVAMVAMGKHGEQPTVVVRLPDPVELESLTDQWPSLVSDLDLEMALVTSEAWRDALDRSDLLWEDEALTPALVYGWPDPKAPSWLQEIVQIDDARSETTPVTTARNDGCTLLWLAPAREIEGEDHRRAISHIGDLAAD